MIIDKFPSISNNIIEVVHNIDINEDVAITMNGTITLLKEDIEFIEENKIKLYDNLNIDYENNEFVVFYSRLFL